MKKLLLGIVMLLAATLLTGCPPVDENVELLYSGSIKDNESYTYAPIIESYEAFSELGYPINLMESYFESNILYSKEMIYQTGVDLLGISKFKEEGNTLEIYINDDGSEVGQSFGKYLMVFTIKREVYERVENIEIIDQTEGQATSDILLLHSSSSGIDETITWIDDQSTYDTFGYPFELEDTFFNQYSLYTYVFMNNNLGTDIYAFTAYDIYGETLYLQCNEHSELVLDAFGNYTMVFAIPRTIVNEIEDVSVSLSESSVLVFDESMTISTIHHTFLLTFDVSEHNDFMIYFTSETMENITNVSIKLYDEETHEEITLNPFSDFYGFYQTLNVGSYIMSINIVTAEDFVVFDYLASFYI